jgi:hypothetical protein
MSSELVLPPVLFEAAFYSATIPPHGRAPFFVDVEGEAESIARIHERQFVEWTLSVNEIMTALLWAIGAQRPVRVVHSVPRNALVESLNGDFDFLVADTVDPRYTIAIECKLVKAADATDSDTTVVRLGKLKRAIHQANEAARVGFASVYLLIVAVVNASAQRKVNQFHKGLKRDARQRVLQFPQWELLNERVGIAYCELVQTTNKPFDAAGVVVSGSARPAAIIEQSGELTERIVRVVRDVPVTDLRIVKELRQVYSRCLDGTGTP